MSFKREVFSGLESVLQNSGADKDAIEGIFDDAYRYALKETLPKAPEYVLKSVRSKYWMRSRTFEKINKDAFSKKNKYINRSPDAKELKLRLTYKSYTKKPDGDPEHPNGLSYSFLRMKPFVKQGWQPPRFDDEKDLGPVTASWWRKSRLAAGEKKPSKLMKYKRIRPYSITAEPENGKLVRITGEGGKRAFVRYTKKNALQPYVRINKTFQQQLATGDMVKVAKQKLIRSNLTIPDMVSDDKTVKTAEVLLGTEFTSKFNAHFIPAIEKYVNTVIEKNGRQ